MKHKTGFLIGAGASYELGLPLVDELTYEFKSALLRVKDMRYYKLPKEIESIVIPLLHDDNLNYEDIIGRIEVEIKRCRSNHLLYQKWHGVLSQYLEAVFFLLLERHEKNKQYIKERLNLLRPLKKYCEKTPLWIFSLNQDLIIEIIAKALEIPIKYGFYENATINNHNFQVLSRENMENNKFSFFQNTPGINLIKLHGALDIFVKDDEKNILQFLRMTIISGKHKYSSKISTTMDDWFYQIYQGHINHVANLFCIGYSFQDPHVNMVLYDWLSFSNERSMVIVDPFIKTPPDQFRHIHNQIEIINLGFLSFLNKGIKSNMRKVKINAFLRDISRKIIKRKRA